MCYHKEERQPLLFRKSGRQSGFTLVELMITFLIAAILTLAAVAYYQNATRRSRLQGEATAVATRLEQIRTLAQLQSVEYRIRFDSSNNRFIPEFYNRLAGTPSWVAADLIS